MQILDRMAVTPSAAAIGKRHGGVNNGKGREIHSLITSFISVDWHLQDVFSCLTLGLSRSDEVSIREKRDQ